MQGARVLTPVSGGTSVPRPPVERVLLLDSVLLAAAVSLCWWSDALIGKSVLVGGLLFVLPHAWFSWRAFRYRGATASRDVVQGFYLAEAGKFLLTAAGFAMAFAFAGPLQAAVLLSAYIVLHVVNGVLQALFVGI